MRSEDRELNQARWKTDPVDQSVRTVHTIIHHYGQSDYSPGNVKFPDGLQHYSAALGMLSVTHITPVLVLNTCTDAIYAVYNQQF